MAKFASILLLVVVVGFCDCRPKIPQNDEVLPPGMSEQDLMGTVASLLAQLSAGPMGPALGQQFGTNFGPSPMGPMLQGLQPFPQQGMDGPLMEFCQANPAYCASLGIGDLFAPPQDYRVCSQCGQYPCQCKNSPQQKDKDQSGSANLELKEVEGDPEDQGVTFSSQEAQADPNFWAWLDNIQSQKKSTGVSTSFFGKDSSTVVSPEFLKMMLQWWKKNRGSALGNQISKLRRGQDTQVE